MRFSSSAVNVARNSARSSSGLETSSESDGVDANMVSAVLVGVDMVSVTAMAENQDYYGLSVECLATRWWSKPYLYRFCREFFIIVIAQPLRLDTSIELPCRNKSYQNMLGEEQVC